MIRVSVRLGLSPEYCVCNQRRRPKFARCQGQIVAGPGGVHRNSYAASCTATRSGNGCRRAGMPAAAAAAGRCTSSMRAKPKADWKARPARARTCPSSAAAQRL